jgi:hypothetical protein
MTSTTLIGTKLGVVRLAEDSPIKKLTVTNKKTEINVSLITFISARHIPENGRNKSNGKTPVECQLPTH